MNKLNIKAVESRSTRFMCSVLIIVAKISALQMSLKF
jgi:hypothetical protein